MDPRRSGSIRLRRKAGADPLRVHHRCSCQRRRLAAGRYLHPGDRNFSDFENDDGGWEADGWVRIQNVLPQSFQVSLIKQGDTTVVEDIPLTAENTAEIPLEFGNGVDEITLVVPQLALPGRQPLTASILHLELKVTPKNGHFPFNRASSLESLYGAVQKENHIGVFAAIRRPDILVCRHISVRKLPTIFWTAPGILPGSLDKQPDRRFN